MRDRICAGKTNRNNTRGRVHRCARTAQIHDYAWEHTVIGKRVSYAGEWTNEPPCGETINVDKPKENQTSAFISYITLHIGMEQVKIKQSSALSPLDRTTRSHILVSPRRAEAMAKPTACHSSRDWATWKQGESYGQFTGTWSEAKQLCPALYNSERTPNKKKAEKNRLDFSEKWHFRQWPYHAGAAIGVGDNAVSILKSTGWVTSGGQNASTPISS